MKIVGTIVLFLGGMLLLLYPFVLLADVMGLAGHNPDVPLKFVDIVMIACLYYGTLAYPIVYLPCLILAIIMRAKSKDVATFVFSILPLVYLIVIGIPIACVLITGH
jgi:hypothetical protein